MRHDFAEGLRYAVRTPRVRILLGLLFAVSLCVFNFVVVPLLARTVLHLGLEGFGFLMAALGVGAVAGALALGARASPEPRLGLLLGAGPWPVRVSSGSRRFITCGRPLPCSSSRASPGSSP